MKQSSYFKADSESSSSLLENEFDFSGDNKKS